jgi:[ribosomal protein S18]-alanine N-acetyltransferase
VIVRPLDDGEVGRVLASGLHLARISGGFYPVAWEDGEPVGHAHLALTDPPELQDVLVLEGSRRRGVASALTQAAEQEASARGHRILRLTVSVDNAAAQALYRKLGYRDSGLEPRRVTGTVQIRSGPLEVDDTLLTWQKDVSISDSPVRRIVDTDHGRQP